MTPRLKTSKKWTALPKELSEQIAHAFQKQFSTESQAGAFKVEGRIYPEEIMLRVGYLLNGRLRQTNLEVSVDILPKAEIIPQIHLCVDALGALFADYFEAKSTSQSPSEEETSEDLSLLLDLPPVWKEFPFQERKIFLQHTTINSDLEAEADRLLGMDATALLNEEAGEEEEPAETEGAEEGEESEEIDPGPKMFGPRPKRNKLH